MKYQENAPRKICERCNEKGSLNKIMSCFKNLIDENECKVTNLVFPKFGCENTKSD